MCIYFTFTDIRTLSILTDNVFTSTVLQSQAEVQSFELQDRTGGTATQMLQDPQGGLCVMLRMHGFDSLQAARIRHSSFAYDGATEGAS
jgi:hypothetical protein